MTRSVGEGAGSAFARVKQTFARVVDAVAIDGIASHLVWVASLLDGSGSPVGESVSLLDESGSSLGMSGWEVEGSRSSLL